MLLRLARVGRKFVSFFRQIFMEGWLSWRGWLGLNYFKMDRNAQHFSNKDDYTPDRLIRLRKLLNSKDSNSSWLIIPHDGKLFNFFSNITKIINRKAT